LVLDLEFLKFYDYQQQVAHKYHKYYGFIYNSSFLWTYMGLQKSFLSAKNSWKITL